MKREILQLNPLKAFRTVSIPSGVQAIITE